MEKPVAIRAEADADQEAVRHVNRAAFGRDDEAGIVDDAPPGNSAGHPSVTPRLKLLGVAGSFAVCKLPTESPLPPWATAGELFSVTRTPDEISVVCRQEPVPEAVACERDWRCLRVAGSMPFTLVGVLASLTTAVANAGVGVFAFSTFDTDYLLVKSDEFQKAVSALRAAGHLVDAEAMVP